MTPRVRYDAKAKLTNPETWDTPLWFADVTDASHFGKENRVVLAGITGEQSSACFMAGAGSLEAACESQTRNGRTSIPPLSKV